MKESVLPLDKYRETEAKNFNNQEQKVFNSLVPTSISLAVIMAA